MSFCKKLFDPTLVLLCCKREKFGLIKPENFPSSHPLASCVGGDLTTTAAGRCRVCFNSSSPVRSCQGSFPKGLGILLEYQYLLYPKGGGKRFSYLQPPHLHTFTLGWSNFWERKYKTHVMLCQIVIGPQFQNFTLKCCFLTWRMASEIFLPQNGRTKLVLNVFGASEIYRFCGI